MPLRRKPETTFAVLLLNLNEVEKYVLLVMEGKVKVTYTDALRSVN